MANMTSENGDTPCVDTPAVQRPRTVFAAPSASATLVFDGKLMVLILEWPRRIWRNSVCATARSFTLPPPMCLTVGVSIARRCPSGVMKRLLKRTGGLSVHLNTSNIGPPSLWFLIDVPRSVLCAETEVCHTRLAEPFVEVPNHSALPPPAHKTRDLSESGHTPTVREAA